MNWQSTNGCIAKGRWNKDSQIGSGWERIKNIIVVTKQIGTYSSRETVIIWWVPTTAEQTGEWATAGGEQTTERNHRKEG